MSSTIDDVLAKVLEGIAATRRVQTQLEEQQDVKALVIETQALYNSLRDDTAGRLQNVEGRMSHIEGRFAALEDEWRSSIKLAFTSHVEELTKIRGEILGLAGEFRKFTSEIEARFKALEANRTYVGPTQPGGPS